MTIIICSQEGNTVSPHHITSAMPELPEVEANRRAFLRAVGLQEGLSSSSSQTVTVTRVKTCEPFDDIVCEGVSAAELRRALLGATVIAVMRKGKQLWAETSRTQSLLLHFGMTGALIIENEELPQYKAFKVR